MPTDSGNPRFPRSVVWTVAALTAAPVILNLCGADFGTQVRPFRPIDYMFLDEAGRKALFYQTLRGVFVFSLLEWTAFCIALVTVWFSFVHYFLARDIITPIVGTALFFSGCLDAFLVLAEDMLTEEPRNLESFVPIVWTVSRCLNAAIVVAGTAPFIWRDRKQPERGLRYMLLMGLFFALTSYAVVRFFAGIEEYPEIVSVWPEYIHRPLDLIPLAMYLLAAGILLPRVYRRHRSLFARGLQVSILPHVVAQLYAMSSAQLYDNAFNMASAMKVLGYLTPLMGLMVDYSRSYRAQAALRVAQEELRLARDIQVRLMPKAAPAVAGWDVAGRCEFAESVGGDYFDYILLEDGAVRVVVADVSGHDAGASLLMANVRATLRALSRTSDDLQDTVSRLNAFLCEDTQGRRFVTMFLCQISPKSDVIQYLGAGHAAFRDDGDGQSTMLDATGVPLGVSADTPPACKEMSSVPEGGIILLPTDGLNEACNSSGEQFGLARVRETLSSCRGRGAQSLVDELFERVSQFTGSPTSADDVTAVAIIRTKPASGD